MDVLERLHQLDFDFGNLSIRNAKKLSLPRVTVTAEKRKWSVSLGKTDPIFQIHNPFEFEKDFGRSGNVFGRLFRGEKASFSPNSDGSVVHMCSSDQSSGALWLIGMLAEHFELGAVVWNLNVQVLKKATLQKLLSCEQFKNAHEINIREEKRVKKGKGFESGSESSDEDWEDLGDREQVSNTRVVQSILDTATCQNLFVHVDLNGFRHGNALNATRVAYQDGEWLKIEDLRDKKFSAEFVGIERSKLTNDCINSLLDSFCQDIVGNEVNMHRFDLELRLAEKVDLDAIFHAIPVWRDQKSFYHVPKFCYDKNECLDMLVVHFPDELSVHISRWPKVPDLQQHLITISMLYERAKIAIRKRDFVKCQVGRLLQYTRKVNELDTWLAARGIRKNSDGFYETDVLDYVAISFTGTSE